MMRQLAVAILTPIIIGLCMAFVSMYLDIDRLKAGELTTDSKLDSLGKEIREIGENVEEIKWYLIKKDDKINRK